MTEVPTCCPKLRMMLDDAGKGPITIVVRNPDKPFLAIYAASRDRSFAATTGIPHCPFCGADLRALVASSLEAFTALAVEHLNVLPSSGW